jgi:hypothetical protein
MPEMFDLLKKTQRWQLAVTYSPAHLAQVFTEYEGQFYDRAEFDACARLVFDLYLRDSACKAWGFRTGLDQRLYDRFYKPVRWADRKERPW